jgi:hypothetical protein
MIRMKTSWRIVPAALVLSLAFHVSARADDASRLQAARDLLASEHMDQNYAKTIAQILDAQTRTSPQMASLRVPMKEFFTKYMGWDSMKEDIAKIYAQNFTEDELKQITAFYQTPTGQKMMSTIPALTAQSMELSQDRVRDHMSELQEMIAKAKAAEAGGATTGPGSTPAPAAAPTPPPAPAPATTTPTAAP